MILICNIYYHPCYLWLYLFFLCCLYRIAHLENNLPIPSKLLPLTRVLYFKEMINAPCQDWSVAVGFLWKLASFRQLFLYIKFVFLGWFLFRSRSSNTAQLQLSHLSSEKDSVEGRVCFGLHCEQHDPFLLNRPQTEGLLWDSAVTLCPWAACGVTSWVCCQVGGVMILVHLRLVFIENNYRLRLFADLL